MAKKKNMEEALIDVEVSEVKPTVHKKVKCNAAERQEEVKAITDEVEAELNGEASVVAMPRTRLSDSGEIDVSLIPAQKKAYYREIAKVLDEKDLTSIASYGSDLQRAMDTYSSDFLKQSFDSKNSIESAQLISNLLGELHEVNIDDLEAPNAWKRLLRKLPLVKKLVISVEQIKAKYDTIEKNIDGIVHKLETARQISIRDNNNLQKQFENNVDYVEQLGELIIAGKIKSQELDNVIENMKVNSEEYDDYQISDVEEYKNSLDKRLTDLTMLRYAFKQSLTQIRIIQRTNIMNANNTEQQIAMTIPLWKNQLSLAVALYDQKQTLEISSKVADTTNEIFKKNAEMMKTQAIEVAKQNQRTVIDIETLRKTTSDLLATVEGVQKAQLEGAQKRAAAEQELFKLEKQMSQTAIGVATSTQHVIAKELRGKDKNVNFIRRYNTI